jgi:integrase
VHDPAGRTTRGEQPAAGFVLRAIYRLARARRLVTRSPLDDLDPGERPQPRAVKRRRLDERALASLVRHAADPLRIGVALVALTGMRLSEALALRWRDSTSLRATSTSAVS